MKRIFFLLSTAALALSAACTVMVSPASLPSTPLAAVETPAGEPPAQLQETPAQPADTAEPDAAAGPANQPGPAAQPPVKTQAPAGLDGEQFDEALALAVEARDFAALRQLMGSSFVLAGWRSEGQSLSPDDALAQMAQGALAPGSGPAAELGADAAALLDGADPLAFFPPDAVRAFFVDGLGSQGADEALVIVGRDPLTGRRYWKGLLVAQMGFRQDSGAGDLNAFSEQLAQALENRDSATLRSLMPARFAIATFNQSLYEYTADEALRQLELTYLVSGAQPAVRWGTDVTALLSGADALEQWGPNARPVKAVHVMGLGANSGSEALVVIGEDGGRFTWHGILLPENGKHFQAPSGGEPGDVMTTPVQVVTALEELNVRSGPGLHYAVEGRVRQGETAQVSGVSRDGQWWQIYCTQDDSGRCWISADPSLTRAE